jgi:colicin import membrane protein
MSTVTQPRRKGVAELDPNDPFRYGWRYINETTPDGKIVTRQVPLSEEDVLHPQEDDFIMENPLHNDNIYTLRDAVKVRLENRPGFIWLCNCRIAWVPGLEPLGPDIAVLSGVFGWQRTQEGTFHVAEWNAQPVLAIEVTSPSTRSGDLGAKVREYHQAGIPLYVIVDLVEDETGMAVLRFLCYQAGPGGYVLTDLEDPERLWLEPIGLWLVIEGSRLACYDEYGQRLGDSIHLLHQTAEAEQRAAFADRERIEAEQRVANADRERVEAEQRAAIAERERAEAQQREATAEAKMREMEAELRRLRGA